MKDMTLRKIAAGLFFFGLLDLTAGVFVTWGGGPAMMAMGSVLMVIGFIAAV